MPCATLYIYSFTCVCVFLQMPCARLIEVGDEMKRYKPKFDGLDEEKLKEFVQDYTDGKVKVSK